MKKSSRYLQMAAYVMLTAIFIFVIGIAKDCGRLPSGPKEGYSGADTLDIALLYGPGSYYMTADSLAGINLDIANIFSLENSVPVKIWPVTEPSQALEKLEKGAFDILASLPLNNDLKKRFPVSESIFLDRLVLIQLSDSTTGEKQVSSSLDLYGKTVAVTAGSSALKRLQNLSQEIGGDITIEEMPELSDELLTIKVANGSIPLAIVNESVAKAIAEKYPDLKYDSSVSFTQFQVWVFNPSDSLAFQKFNSWFENFQTTPSYRDMLSRY